MDKKIQKLMRTARVNYKLAALLVEAGYYTPEQIEDAEDDKLPVDGELLADIRKVLPKR